MTTDVAATEDPRVYVARGHAAQHNIAQAEALYREIIQTSPDVAEAWNFIGMCELSRGDFVHAQQSLERAATLEPTEAEIWKNVGIVQLAQHHGEDALDAFDRALAMEPMHFAARLHRGAAFEQLGRLDEAAAAYFGAVAAAQSHHKWMNDLTTPPNMRGVVRHAIAFVDQHRKRILMAVLQPLREKYGADSVQRIEQGLLVYLDEIEANYPDPRQRCKFLYVPGLATQPFYDRAQFPWQDLLEAHCDEIRAELQQVLAGVIGIEPFLGTNDNAVLKAQGLLDGTRGKAAWNSFFFHRHGKLFEQNSSRCPKTTAVLESLPLVHIRGHAPEVLFSILTPGSHILKHHGVTNTRLVTHLPLIIPEDCAISVGGVEHAWKEGHCVTFDDTFEHEAWNRSGKVRAVMILDAWHPDLTEVEREAVAMLVAGIGDFNQSANVDAPPAD